MKVSKCDDDEDKIENKILIHQFSFLFIRSIFDQSKRSSEKKSKNGPTETVPSFWKLDENHSVE